MQPPNQELIVRDLHDNMWTFRHIYRGRVEHYLISFSLSSWIKSAAYTLDLYF
jgi:auxin response factor